MATNPHAAGRGRDSRKHKEPSEMTSCNLLVVDKQCQGTSLHCDGELVRACRDFVGANKVRALMSVHDIKVRGAMIKS